MSGTLRPFDKRKQFSTRLSLEHDECVHCAFERALSGISIEKMLRTNTSDSGNLRNLEIHFVRARMVALSNSKHE